MSVTTSISPWIKLFMVRIVPPGIAATMPAKMMSEMPLPTPNSVIFSPSHIMKAVPAVNVRMVINRKPQPGDVTTAMPSGLKPSSQKLMAEPWTTESTTVP